MINFAVALKLARSARAHMRAALRFPLLCLILASTAFAQPPPAAPLSASPGRSGGEGGTSGPTNVTIRAATKDNPYLGTIVGQPRAMPTGNDPATRCIQIAYSDFTTIKDAPTQIVDAAVRPTKGDEPAMCVINGFIAPQVAFRLWMPLTTWNGKYMQNGCGGRCGDFLPDQCEIQSKRGYACLANDLGHKGTTYDNVWAIDNIAGEIDFGFRATHVATLAGKVITEKYYSQKPKYSYFIGASTGGRQALVIVQRFPLDFDGVIAGVAGVPVPGQPPGMRGIGVGSLLYANGKAVLSPEDIRMVHQAVVARCDAEDGLKDGIITDSRGCPFQPKELLCTGDKAPTCLTKIQVEALDAVYETGTQRGSELGWIGAYVAADGSAGRYIPKNSLGYSYPYSWVFNDTSNPDIRAFKNAGRKFIMYAGWADEVVNPLGSSSYYDTVERVIGNRKDTQDFFRLFMIPGEAHIPGGVGAESINYLYALEDWVEKGKAPDRLIGRKLKTIKQMLGPIVLESDMRPDNYLYSRPHYPYPIQSRYKGKGDPDDAANFGPWDPSSKKWVK